MKEEEVSPQTVLELREEVLQRVEAVDSRMRALSLVTIVVAALLVVGLAIQLALPFASSVPTVTVNLSDPVLVAVETGVTLLGLIWLYVGVSNYRFVASMAKSVKAARAREAELAKSMIGEEVSS